MLSLFQQSIDMTLLTSLEIQAYLPHRPPFLWVDQVVEIIPQQSIIATKKMKTNAPLFKGHFPGDPMMPGVLIIEAMAQTTHILANYTASPHKKSLNEAYVLAKVDSIKFKHPVLPGNQLCMKAQKKWERLPFLCYTTQAFVGDQLVCEGQITIAKRGVMNQKEAF